VKDNAIFFSKGSVQLQYREGTENKGVEKNKNKRKV